jgi:hypothetical protein
MAEENVNTGHLETRLHYTLRIASAMCFVGHGAFGIITKKIWLNYFAVFGIGPVMGYHIMPWLGTFDVLCGLSLLLFPTRAVLLWLVIWGTTTAMLRPLSGEAFAEAVERAGNFGAPLSLLLICGTGHTLKEWFARISPEISISAETTLNIFRCLQVIVFMLLAGHGWLNLIGKGGLLVQYTALGFSNPAEIARILGVFEILAAASVIIRPMRPVLIGLLVWKMASELMYPRWEVFEWIERGCSYGTILALWFTLPKVAALQSLRTLKQGAAKSSGQQLHSNRLMQLLETVNPGQLF